VLPHIFANEMIKSSCASNYLKNLFIEVIWFENICAKLQTKSYIARRKFRPGPSGFSIFAAFLQLFYPVK